MRLSIAKDLFLVNNLRSSLQAASIKENIRYEKQQLKICRIN